MAKGLDAGKDPKLVAQGLLKLENSVQLYEGEFRKRYGMAAVTGTYATEEKLARYKEMCWLLGDQLRVYDPEDDAFDVLGDLGFMDVSTETIEAHGETFNYSAEVAENSFYRCVAWEEFDNITSAKVWRIRTYDKANGLRIDENSFLYQIRLITINDVIYFFVPDGSPNQKISYGYITSSGEVSSSPTVTAISGSTDTYTAALRFAPFDVCQIGARSVMIVHKTSAEDAEVIACDDIASPTWSTNVIALTQAESVGCCRLVDDVGIALYSDTGATPKNVQAQGFDESASSVVSAATIYSWSTSESISSLGGIATSSTEAMCYVALYLSGSENPHEVTRNTYTNTGGTGGAGTPSTWMYGMQPVSKPFPDAVDTTFHYLTLQRDSYSLWEDTRSVYAVVRHDGRMCARFLAGRAQSLSSRLLTPVTVVGTNNWRFTVVRKTGDYRQSGEDTTCAVLVDLTRATPDEVQALESRHQLHIANACPWVLDGRLVTEQGFFSYPLIVSAVASAGGSLDGPATYGYLAIFEDYDSPGQRHRSAPSAVVQATTDATNKTVTLTIGTLPLTHRENVNIAIYRTEGDGSIFYRRGSVANSTSARTVTFVDSAADSILKAEMVYTTGNVLANMPPPPHRVSCLHQERLFVVHRESEEDTVRYTKTFVDGEAAAFADDFLEVRFPPAGGRITALASFMGSLLAFKADRVYEVHGPGLSDAGSGRGFSSPVLISETIGCRNQRTIVEIPQGLMFEAADGICLLDKSLQVKPIGQPAHHWFQQVTLRSAVPIPEEHLVVFPSDDEALVYDYKHNLWGAWTGMGCSDAVEVGGVLWLRMSSGAVRRESRSIYQDADTAVVQTIRPGWFTFEGKLAGYRRVYRLLLSGQLLSACKVRVKIAYDYDPVWVDNLVLEPDASTAFDVDAHFGTGLASGYRHKALLLEVHPSRQKCSAILVEVSGESPSSGAVAEGFALTGISFVVGAKPGAPARLDADRRF
jgi:hypothetical protein